MKTVWKYRLDPDITIEMPEGAEVLCVQTQNGQPTLWALVDSSNPLERRRFVGSDTGHPIPDDSGKYVGTFQIDRIKGRTLVFHVFEVRIKEVCCEKAT